MLFVLLRIPALYTLGSVSLQVLVPESNVTSESELRNDLKIYRLTGACSLAAVPVSFIEFPLYFVCGPIAPIEMIDCAKSIGCCRGPISFGASIN